MPQGAVRGCECTDVPRIYLSAAPWLRLKCRSGTLLSPASAAQQTQRQGHKSVHVRRIPAFATECICVHTHIYICIYTLIVICMCIYLSLNAFMQVCMFAGIDLCLCIYTCLLRRTHLHARHTTAQRSESVALLPVTNEEQGGRRRGRTALSQAQLGSLAQSLQSALRLQLSPNRPGVAQRRTQIANPLV